MSTLSDLVFRPGVSPAEVAEHLDALAPAQRVAETVALGRDAQQRLWEIAGRSMTPLALSDFVPTDAPALQPFPFEGKNSLPVLTRFRKVFYRRSEGGLGGYNDSPAGWIVGPGYYVFRESPDGPGPVVVDYMEIPASHPAGWPEIRSNEQGLTRFVYGFTKDFLRRVSRDVVIGRAYRRGEAPMPNWFVLCRP